MNRVLIFLFLLATLALHGKANACPAAVSGHLVSYAERDAKPAPVVLDASDLTGKHETLNAAEDEDEEEEACIKKRASWVRELLVFSRDSLYPLSEITVPSFLQPTGSFSATGCRYLLNRVIRI